MSKRKPTNVPASVRARLENLARQRKAEFQLVLGEFATERFLYRLGVSRHAEHFVLKGAMLFRLWSADRRRATWDLDLLGLGPDDVADVVSVMKEICALQEADGIVFDSDSIRGEQIRAGHEQVGVRVRMEARLADARIPMQIDVGFGDAMIVDPLKSMYPTLLDHLPPVILVYPQEVVIAEKLEAMMTRGVTNTRMKDFYDVYVMASSFDFDGSTLCAAIRATFTRRNTPFSTAQPLVLTAEFLGAPERNAVWRAFLQRSRLGAPPGTEQLAAALMGFLGPVLAAAAADKPFVAAWPPGGPWDSEGGS